MSNKSAGTSFEKEFANIIAQNWFWVHCFQDNKNGQPCDVLAARSGHAYLFDCKNCEGDYFQLSRMEENQYNAMKLFELTGNSRGMFAIKFPNAQEIYLVGYWVIKSLLDKGIKRIDCMDCSLYGESLGRWLKTRNQIDGWGDEDASDNQQRDQD